jgi:hypothetical protein
MFARAAATRRTRAYALLRVIVALLVVCVASGGALPSWAQLVEGPGAHVCQCSVVHHDCLCARCHPDDPSLWTSTESIKGECGTRNELMAPGAIKAVVLAPPSVPVATLLAELTFLPPPPLHDASRPPPPIPPPRVA